jgi:hypothetical protein
MAVPESATEVFAPNFYGTSGYEAYLGAPADMTMLSYLNGGSQNAVIRTRMLPNNKGLVTSSNAAAITVNSTWDNMFGVTPVGTTYSHLLSFTWKRAPGFFDVVAYTGNSTAGRTVSHNLGVAPEMMWVKSRTDSTFWAVYHKDVGYSSVLRLDSSSTPITVGMVTNTSDTDFTLSTSAAVNSSGHNFIAYLFATLPGISKVGSYTGNGSSQTIDCGFSSGARFVLVKRADATGNWMVMDTARGIVTGDEGVLFLDLTIAESTGDWIDPASSGFIINDVGTGFNENGSTYIFYAIA